MVSLQRFFLIKILLFFPSSDFQIREANALPLAHTYTVMCVLPINLFNQVRNHFLNVNISFFFVLYSKYLHFYGFGL